MSVQVNCCCCCCPLQDKVVNNMAGDMSAERRGPEVEVRTRNSLALASLCACRSTSFNIPCCCLHFANVEAPPRSTCQVPFEKEFGNQDKVMARCAA
jgi:hypothetical protein